MFDYTKAIFGKTLSDLKRLEKAWSFSTISVYIAYLIYAIAANYGILTANIILLSLSVAYFVFYLVVIIKGSEILKSRKRFAKKAYRYLKYMINTATLITALYNISVHPYDTHPLRLIAVIFMTMLLLIQLVLEVSITVVERRFNMFIEAFYADIEFVTKPVNTVKNVFKRITGQDVEPERERSEEREYLDMLVQEAYEENSQTSSTGRRKRDDEKSSPLGKYLSKIMSKRANKNEDDDEEIDVEVSLVAKNDNDQNS